MNKMVKSLECVRDFSWDTVVLNLCSSCAAQYPHTFVSTAHSERICVSFCCTNTVTHLVYLQKIFQSPDHPVEEGPYDGCMG
jgi:hypothetical protein